MLLNCAVGEDSWESLREKGYPTSPSWEKEISPGCSLEELMLKLKLLYFGHLMWKTDSLEKTVMLGKDWGQEGKGATEDEMAGRHHRLDGPESGWVPRLGDGQGGLACCSLWGREKSDMTEQLNWTELSQASRILQQYDFLKKKKRDFFHEINTIQDLVLYFLCLFLFMFIIFTYLFFAFSIPPPPSSLPFAAHTHTHTQYFSFSLRDSPWEYRLSCGKLNLLSAFFAWAILSNWTVFWMPCP